MNSISYNRNNALLHLKYTTLALFLCLYVLSLVLVFYYYIQPSLTGSIPLRIAADSSAYLKYAEVIKESGWSFSNIAVPLISFSSNSLGPVVIATLLNNNLLIFLFNVAVFVLGYTVLIRKINVKNKLLLILLLLNPMMFVSLLSINKEIIGFFAVSLVACYLNDNKNKALLVTSLILSIFVRWQLFMVIVAFLLLNYKYFLLNKHRIATIILIIIAVTFMYPTFSGFVDEALSTEVLEGNTIVALTEMQRNYKFFIAILPKMFLNFCGSVVLWFSSFYIDKENIITNIIIGNELFSLLITIILLLKKKITIHSDLLYFYLFYLLVYSISPFVQSRYIFPCYVLLCLELCRKRESGQAMHKRLSDEYTYCNSSLPCKIS